MDLNELLDKYGKRCPICRSQQVTTINNEAPLRHRCIDCGHEFLDSDAWVKARQTGLESGN